MAIILHLIMAVITCVIEQVITIIHLMQIPEVITEPGRLGAIGYTMT